MVGEVFLGEGIVGEERDGGDGCGVGNEFTTGEEKFVEREREKRVYKSFSGYGEEEST